MGFHSPSETSRVSSGHVRLATIARAQLLRLPPSRFPAPTAFSRMWRRLCRPGLPHLITCAFELSQPLGAFVRPMPAWPCFMPDPLLGFCPSEPFSSRAAVRRHPAHMFALMPFSPRPHFCSAIPHQVPKHPPRRRCSCHPQPAASGLCSTRESATSRRWFRPPRARSSLGLASLQGLFLRWPRAALPALPLRGFPLGAPKRSVQHPSGSCRQRARLHSLDCRHSLLGFLTS